MNARVNLFCGPTGKILRPSMNDAEIQKQGTVHLGLRSALVRASNLEERNRSQEMVGLLTLVLFREQYYISQATQIRFDAGLRTRN
jgi:hypothetical protein